MKKKTTLAVLLIAMCTSAFAPESEPVPQANPPPPIPRQMNVTQGPEIVFGKPAEQVMPALKGAKATHINGRVGNEFVFWGYRLKSGQDAFFYACAKLEGVDCKARRAQICDTPMTVLETADSEGRVRRIDCRKYCTASEGSTAPCCSDIHEQDPLQLGLVSCQ